MDWLPPAVGLVFIVIAFIKEESFWWCLATTAWTFIYILK